MFKKLMLGFKNLIHIRVKDGRVCVEDVYGEEKLEGADELVINSETNQVIEVGGLSLLVDSTGIIKKNINVFGNIEALPQGAEEIEALLAYYVRKVTKRKVLLAPEIRLEFIDRKYSLNDQQKQSLTKICLNIGARAVEIVESN